MGLDQYAYTRAAREEKTAFLEKAEREGIADAYRQAEEKWPDAFYWRKHAKLQAYMEDKFSAMTGLSAAELNCEELELTLELVTDLESHLKNGGLPESPGGFFYGHQFQDDSARKYLEQDLKFCEWARWQIEAGEVPVYSCWW